MIDEEHIDIVWKKMSRMYGHKFTTHYGPIDDGTWLACLRDLDPGQVISGLDALLHGTEYRNWPPTVFEFRDLCIGLPSLDKVTDRLLRQNYSDALTVRVKGLIGSWVLTHGSEFEIRKRVREVFDQAQAEMIKNLAIEKKSEARKISNGVD